MLISGIRQKLSYEFNLRRSAMITKCLVHYLQMFAFLGIIFPVLILIDYCFLDRISNDELVIDRYYKFTDNLNSIEYKIFTDSYHFRPDHVFYEHINKDDKIIISRTKIFKTVTNVSFKKNLKLYKCNPMSIYNWPIFIVGVTFICSLITIFKIRKWFKKHDFMKNNSVINFVDHDL